MARLTDDVKAQNEEAVRAAMDRLLRGDLPNGGKPDLKTLAAEAGVPRTGFYAKKNRDGSERPGPYQHLGEEFERRLRTLQEAGQITDPRAAQIERLKAQVVELKKRVTRRDEALAELTEFKTLAISRLAAQYTEIEGLRRQATAVDNIRSLPGTRNGAAPVARDYSTGGL
ncbi:hypothetical protein [Streptomyces sp. NPDC058401]|uniref:hypothetical protein n=1 Tax=Streptomyces sp. NPDC058401 TaxID=3346480 RepID=UPI003667B843